MPVQNLRGHPQKKLGAKNMSNLAWFRTTSKFGGEYLRKGWKYLKSDKYLIYRDSSCVRQNKSGELWSTNYGDLDVESYPPKSTFSEDDISAPRVCCTPKFLYVLENNKVLLAHPHRGRGPSYNFSQKGRLKIGLKCTKCTFITSAVVRVAPQHFVTWRAAMWKW